MLLLLTLPATVAVVAQRNVPPRVTWAPEVLNVELFPGTSEPFSAQMRIDGNQLTDGQLSLAPAIGRFMTLSATALPAIGSGQALIVSGVVSVPSSTAPGTYEGTLHVRSGNRTIPSPQKVAIHVVAATADHVPSTPSSPSADRISRADDGPLFVRDELVLILQPATSDPIERIRAIARQWNAVIVGSVPETLTYQLQFDVSTLDELKAIKGSIVNMPDVNSANLSTMLTVQRLGVDGYDDEWSETSPNGDNWNLEMIKAPSAWSVETGERTLPVAILDGDFDPHHEDLANNIDLVAVEDHSYDRGHGTHVSGIACAEGNNGRGIAGVAWRCSLRVYDVFGDLKPPPGFVDDENVVTATYMQWWMNRAVSDGARIVNMSLGMVERKCPLPPTSFEDPDWVTDTNRIMGAAIERARKNDHQVLWLFAAGNACRDAKNESPASLVADYPENTIAVGAVDPTGNLARYSNHGNLVTVAAPGGDASGRIGGDVRSTLPGDRYGQIGGTSQAAPHVTGLAALVWSAHPELSAAQVRNCIVAASQIHGRPTADSFNLITAPEAVACSSVVTLGAGQSLRVVFRTKPPFADNHGTTGTPDALQFSLLFPIATSGSPAVAVRLFDGNTPLSDAVPVNVGIGTSARFSASTGTGSVPVPFDTILSGAIDGIIEMRVTRGTITFDLNSPFINVILEAPCSHYPTSCSGSPGARFGFGPWTRILNRAIR